MLAKKVLFMKPEKMRFFTSMHCNCLEQCNCWTTVWIQCSELTKANYADQVFIKHWAHQKISLFEHWWSWTYALAIVVDDDRTPTTEVGRLRCRWCLRRHLGRNRKEGIRKLTLFSLLYRLIIRLWLAVIRSIDRESFFLSSKAVLSFLSSLFCPYFYFHHHHHNCCWSFPAGTALFSTANSSSD